MLDLTEQLTWLQSCNMRPNPNRNHLWYFNNTKSKLNSALYLTHIQHQFPWPTSSLLLSALQDWESWKNKLHSVKPHGQCCQLKCYPCYSYRGWWRGMKQNSLFSRSDASFQLFSLQFWLHGGLASSDNIWMWFMELALSYRIWKGLRHDSFLLQHLELTTMHTRKNSWERPRPFQGWSPVLALAPFVVHQLKSAILWGLFVQPASGWLQDVSLFPCDMSRKTHFLLSLLAIPI